MYSPGSYTIKMMALQGDEESSNPEYYSDYSGSQGITIPGTPLPSPVISAGAAVNGQIPVTWSASEYQDEGDVHVSVFGVKDGALQSVHAVAAAGDGILYIPVQPTGTQLFAIASSFDNYINGDCSTYSNFVPGDGTTSSSVPATPENFSIFRSKPHSLSPVGAIWDNTSNDETHFVLQRSCCADFDDPQTLKEYDLGADTTFQEDDIKPQLWGQTYYYRVKATNDAGDSAWSNVLSITNDRVNCVTCNGLVSVDGTGKQQSQGLNANDGTGSEGADNNTAGQSTGKPKLYQLNCSTDHLTAYYGPGIQTFFDKDPVTGKYNEAFGGTDTLTNNGGTFTLTDADGNRMTFGAFAGGGEGISAPMVSRLDKAGNKWQVTSTNGLGNAVEAKITNADSTETEDWLYTYVSGGVNDGKLESVTQKIKKGATWVTVRSMTVAYYDGTTSGGRAGDILSVIIKDGSGNVISDDVYRYYTDDTSGGFTGGVKFALSEGSYRRLLEANPGSSFDDLTDAQVASYADTYYEYNDAHQITSRTVQGEGCSACTGGQGTYGYTYTSRTDDTSDQITDTNTWMSKTVETLPDGNQNITYYNRDGNVMLAVFKDTTTGGMYGTFNVFDDAGRVIMTAAPSAISLPSDLATIEQYTDLMHKVSGNYEFLNDNAGKITVTDYYTSTTATETTAGGAAGYEQDVKIQKGEDGTPIVVSSEDYFAHTDGVSTIYPVADSTQYRNTDSTGGQTTSYAYTWFTDSLEQQTQTTTYAAVTTAQNGSGTANSVTDVYNQLGQLIWHKDESGFLTYNEYDPITGGLTKTIQDVNTSATTTFDASTLPSGWTTPSGAGLNLITTYSVDLLGRQTKKTDPNGNVTITVYNDAAHETRTYTGWNSTTGTTTGPITVRRNDLANSYGETLTFSWSGTGANALPVDSNGNPLGTESLTSSYATIQSLTRDIVSAAGQVIYRDLYTSLSGTSYSQSSQTLGSAGTNYLRTTYGYDWRGRQARVTAPDGTITQTVYDGLGRVVSVWKGTNNTGWTQTDPSGGGATGNNMMEVSSNVYDNGTVGDSNLTASTQYSGSASYGTDYTYDWRDRMVAVRGPDNIVTKYTLDNLGEQTETDTYADANTDFAIDPGELIGKSTVAYDELGRAYQATQYQNARQLDTGALVSSGTTATVTLVNHGYATGQVVTIAGASNSLYNGTFTITVTGQNTFTYTLSSSLTGTATGSRITVQADKRLTNNTWYDPRGNVAKTQNPSGLINKWFYDGADRLFRDDTTADATEVASGTYADALTLTNDAVIEQNDYYLDKGGRTRIVTNWKEPSTFTNPYRGLPEENHWDHNAVVYYYDAADRLVDSLNFGRDGSENGTTSSDRFVWAQYTYAYIDGNHNGTPDVLDHAQDYDPGLSNPTSQTSYQWIYTGYSYDAAGRPQFVTDNAGHKTETLYDFAGRTTATVENYTGTGAVTETTAGDTNRTTQYVYDNWGRLSKQIALNPKGSGNGVEQQTTQYVYGSDVDRSWVTATLYPDSSATVSVDSSGKGTVSGTDATFAEYDQLGRQTQTTDQRGVTHAFTYDAAGRFASDSVDTSSAPSVDNKVQSIAYTYDAEGRTSAVTSYDGSATPQALNQVAYTYDGWGNVTKDAEDHDGLVSSTTPAVNYLYVDGSGTTATAKYVRLDRVQYPKNNNGSIGTYIYSYEGTEFGAALNRVQYIRDASSSQLALVQYFWLGINTLTSQIMHPQVSGGLVMNTGSNGNDFIQLDRYYRHKNMQWQSSNGTTQFQQLIYTYDRMGNVLTKDNNSSGTGAGNWDETYAYDGLNRVVQYNRGSLSSGVISGTNLKFQQTWTLDALGNSTGFSQTNNDTTLTGSQWGTFAQTRTANAANEITGTTGTSGTGGAFAGTSYDASGNQTLGGEGDSPTTQLGYVYDGWNRLVGVGANHDGDLNDAGDVRYSYDGTGRRITKFVDNANDGSDASGTTEEYYQDEQNQVLEVRSGTVTGGVKTINGNPKERYLWDLNYVDAPVFVEFDTDLNGTADQRLYTTWDANYNITSLVTQGGKTVERYEYTPYGQQIILNGTQNYSGSGADADGADWSVDTTGSDYGFLLGFQGLRMDPESGNWYARARYESPTQGQWLERDPKGAIDGFNVYRFERSNPLIYTDPMGTEALAAWYTDVLVGTPGVGLKFNIAWPGSYAGYFVVQDVSKHATITDSTGKVVYDTSEGVHEWGKIFGTSSLPTSGDIVQTTSVSIPGHDKDCATEVLSGSFSATVFKDISATIDNGNGPQTYSGQTVPGSGQQMSWGSNYTNWSNSSGPNTNNFPNMFGGYKSLAGVGAAVDSYGFSYTWTGTMKNGKPKFKSFSISWSLPPNLKAKMDFTK